MSAATKNVRTGGGVVTKAAPTTDLVGHWTFDEGTGTTSSDSSGFDNHAAITNATWEANGRSGACLRYNPTNSYVGIPDGEWNRGTPVTYSAWYKAEGSPTGYLFGHRHTGTIPGSFYFAPGNMQFGAYDGANASFLARSRRPTPPGVWTMVTVAVSATEVRLYKNGALEATAPVTAALPAVPGTLFLGARGEVQPNGDNHFRGLIDEVTIYSRALSDADVLALYQSYDPIADERPERGLHLRFDEGGGPTAVDSSGQHNHGTLMGATWAPTGVSGTSLYFNGTSSFVRVADGTWNNGTPATYSLWYRAEGSPRGHVLAHNINSNVTGGFALNLSTSGLGGYDSTNANRFARFWRTPPGVWAMATAVFTETELKVYKNGVLEQAVPITGGFPYVQGALDIGARGAVPDNFFRGWLDEVSVHRRALSDAEVLALYQSYTHPADDRPDLVARYTFDEGTGSVLNDSSGLGHHGQIENALWAPQGIKGGSLYFNGTNAVVRVQDGTWNNGTPATYIAWYKTDGAPVGWVYEHRLGANNPGAFALVAPGRYFAGYDKRNVSTVARYPTVPNGNWVMIAAVITDTEVRVYQNGVFAAATPIVGGFPYTPGQFAIGARGVERDNWFKGWIDELSIYRRALSAAEIQALFEGTRTCPPGDCSLACPCNAGRPCDPAQPNGFCAAGLSCQIGVGEMFGLPSTMPVCWDPGCNNPSSSGYECGSTSARCGFCRPTCPASCEGKTCGDNGCGGVCTARCAARQPCSSNTDCGSGLACGMDNGGRFGLGAGSRVCWPVTCERSSGSCGTTASPCGTCPAPVRDGPGGSCGTCALGATCVSDMCQTVAADVQHPLPDNVDLSTAAVGTLPGQHQVTDSGDASYRIPLELPPGRGGIEPKLALRYNSSGPNGFLGKGWWLEGLSMITRCNRTIAQDGFVRAPQMEFVDAYCLDGRRLEPEPDGVRIDGDALVVRFRTEEDSLTRVEAFFGTVTDPGSEVSRIVGPAFFRVFDKDGRISDYGTPDRYAPEGFSPDNARVFGTPRTTPSGRKLPAEPLMWLLAKVADRTGNEMLIHYYNQRFALADDLAAARYMPAYLSYGSPERPINVWFISSLDPAFGGRPRPDPIRTFRDGVFTDVEARLHRILVKLGGKDRRRYDLEYETPPSTSYRTNSRLLRVTDCDGGNVCKPPTQFTYLQPTIPLNAAQAIHGGVAPQTAFPQHVLDMNGDGYDDILYVTKTDNSCAFGNHEFWRWAVSLSSVERSADGYSFGQTPINTQIKLRERDSCTAFDESFPIDGSGAGAVIDWDDDGRHDFLELDLERDSGSDYTVLSHDGQNVLRYGTGIPRAPRGQAYVLDVDGDSFRDLLICDPLDAEGDEATWRLYRHRGNLSQAPLVNGKRAGFTEADRVEVDMDAPCKVGNVTLDKDGDGADDLLIANEEDRRGTFFTIRPDGTTSRMATNQRAATTTIVTTMKSIDRSRGMVVGWASSSFDRPASVLLDLNGDGLTDIINFGISESNGTGEARLDINLNAGNGLFAPQASHYLPMTGLNARASQLRVTAWDANSDGMHDVLYTLTGSNGRFQPWRLLYSTGMGFTTQGPALTIPAELGTEMLQAIDTNGDGAYGLLGVGMQVAERTGTPQERLTSATDGLGARVDFAYRPLTDPRFYLGEPAGAPACGFPFLCGASRRMVVTSVSEYDVPFVSHEATAPSREFVFDYQGLRGDALGRGSLGFSTRRETQVDPPTNTPKRESVTFFDNTTRRDELGAYPFAWRPQRRQVTAFVDGVAFTTEQTSEYEVFRSTQSSFAVLPRLTTRSKYSTVTATGARDVLTTEIEQVIARDPFGHPVITTSQLGASEGKFLEQRYAHMEDDSRVDSWLIELETLRKQTHIAGDMSKTRTVQRQYTSNGLLELQTDQPGDPQLELQTAYMYTEHGLVRFLAQTDASGQVRTVTTDYDGLGEYPILMRNGKDQPTEVEHDRVTGKQVFRRDPNGLVAHTGYDGFGRLRAEIDEANVLTTTSYRRTDASRPFVVETRTTGGTRIIEERDVKNRLVNAHTFGLGGKQLVTTHAYDNDGNLRLRSRPTELGTTPVPDRAFLYDNQRRLRLEFDVDSNATETCYNVRATCVRNPRGFARCELLDDRGRVARALDPFASTGCGAALAAASSGQGTGVSYGYGAFDDLGLITDQRGNLTVIGTDALGNVNLHIDADSGLQTFAYNGFGQLVQGTDNEGRNYRFDYDALGRRVRRTDAGGTPRVTEWIWDGGETLETGEGELIGKLTETRSPDGVTRRFLYEPTSGALRGHSDTIAGEGPFRIAFIRDSANRVTEVHYPIAPGSPAFAVANAYDDYGHITQVRSRGGLASDTTYWQALATNAHDQLTAEFFGNLAVMSRSYEAHGWPESVATLSGVSGQAVQHFEFQDYDPNGNARRKLEHVSGRTETYTYDHADRLTSDSGTTLGYDEIGNVYGNSATSYDPARPHQIRTDGIFGYFYDNVGNRTEKHAPDAGVQRTSYTPFNKPIEIWNEDLSGVKGRSLAFLYDADQVRARKQSDTTTTVYSAGYYERRSPRAGGPAEHVYYVRNGSRVVAQVAVTEGETEDRPTYLHADHLGTPTLISDAWGIHVAVDYDAFGLRRTPADPSGVSVTFTGHEADAEHGLVNMGGRIYDPRIRQFTTPDPIQRVYSATRTNRYLYARGNPLRFVDPNGYDDVAAPDFADPSFDLSDDDFDQLISDLAAGKIDNSTAPLPAAMDPLTSTVSLLGLEQQNQQVVSTSGESRFILIGNGDTNGPLLAIDRDFDPCKTQQCLHGDGSMTDGSTYEKSILLRKLNILGGLRGGVHTGGFYAAYYYAGDIDDMSLSELNRAARRIEVLNKATEAIGRYGRHVKTVGDFHDYQNTLRQPAGRSRYESRPADSAPLPPRNGPPDSLRVVSVPLD